MSNTIASNIKGTSQYQGKSYLDLGLGDLLGGGGDVRQPGNIHPAGSGPTDCST